MSEFHPSPTKRSMGEIIYFHSEDFVPTGIPFPHRACSMRARYYMRAIYQLPPFYYKLQQQKEKKETNDLLGYIDFSTIWKWLL